MYRSCTKTHQNAILERHMLGKVEAMALGNEKGQILQYLPQSGVCSSDAENSAPAG